MSPEGDTPSKRPTRAEKQAETRRRLLDAAEKVFRERGFHGATIEAITAAAGFSRGAFYSNFDSREELFTELLGRRVYEDYEQMITSVPQEATPREQVRWAARTLADYHRDPDQRWSFELWLELLARAVRDPEFSSLASAAWRRNRAGLAARFGDQPPGVRGTPIDAKALASAVIAIDIGLKIQNLVDPEEVGLELYEPLFDLLFGHLFEQPG